MKYIVTNIKAGRSYETYSMFDVSLDRVWESVKSWFSPGTAVRIETHTFGGFKMKMFVR